MQDIIPPNKKTIRNVPLRRNSHVHKEEIERNIPEPEYEFDEDILNDLEKKHSWFFYLSAIVIPILIIGVSLGIYSVKFSSAEVTVVPKTTKSEISLNIDAVKNDSTLNGSLRFNVLEKNIRKEIEVTASGEEKVENKASGQIIIYNRYSTSPQTLIRNTRFQTSDGKIYRIQNQVVIPGYKKNGNTIEAGSVEVVVYADSAGENYNIGLSDFTIPGFKGSPQFETIYARSKTPIIGGFVGIQKKVSEQDVNTKIQSIVNELKSEIVKEQNTEETVVLSKAVYSEQRELSRKNKDQNTAIIEYEINIFAFVFPKKELSRLIVEKTSLNEDKSGAYVKNFENIDIDTRPVVTPWKSNSVTLTFRGNADFTWYYNPEQIANSLAGRSKKDFNTIMAGHLGVRSSESKIIPFIKSTFPKDPLKIKVLEK